ncbi:FecR domain-containing protein [Oxalobacteraceae bacterium A2-2]
MLRQLFAAVAVLAMPLVHAAEAGKIIFATGKAQVAERAAALDDAVQEGELLTTGADGYIYIRTVDKGLFILRPNTRARIATYHIDAKNPANTRIKLELLSGVARSQSGDAVKLARQNFRFNTPVAAIGVRGTDFTVFTDQDTSRVTVLSGGITISGFGGACQPQGIGPCDGTAARDLSAAQKGQLLQVQRGQATPQLLPSTITLAPDVVAPPRSDEPIKTATTTTTTTAVQPILDAQKTVTLQQQVASAGLTNGGKTTTTEPPAPIVTVPPVTETPTTPTTPSTPTTPTTPDTSTKPSTPTTPTTPTTPETPTTPTTPTTPDTSTKPSTPTTPTTPETPTTPTTPTTPVTPVDPVVTTPAEPERQIVWGRWQKVADLPVNVDLITQLRSGSELIRTNADFALFRTAGKDYVAPERGSVAFTLQQSEAYVHYDNTAIATTAAKVENGLLSFNFDKSTFATSLDLVVSSTERIGLASTGVVAANGRFEGGSIGIPGNTMVVGGVLSSDNGGTAAYLFDARLSKDRTVYGATLWGKPVSTTPTK